MSWHPYVKYDKAEIKIRIYNGKGVVVRIPKGVTKKFGYEKEYKFIAFAYDPEDKKIGFAFLTCDRDKKENCFEINNKRSYSFSGFCKYFKLDPQKIVGDYEPFKDFEKSAYVCIQLKNEE